MNDAELKEKSAALILDFRPKFGKSADKWMHSTFGGGYRYFYADEIGRGEHRKFLNKYRNIYDDAHAEYLKKV